MDYDCCREKCKLVFLRKIDEVHELTPKHIIQMNKNFSNRKHQQLVFMMVMEEKTFRQYVKLSIRNG